MGVGCGCSFGSLLGALLYSYLGYINTFYMFAGAIALVGMASVYLVPSRIN